MNLSIGEFSLLIQMITLSGVRLAWPGRRDMGDWPVCLLVELWLKGQFAY